MSGGLWLRTLRIFALKLLGALLAVSIVAAVFAAIGFGVRWIWTHLSTDAQQWLIIIVLGGGMLACVCYLLYALCYGIWTLARDWWKESRCEAAERSFL